ncbi:TolC family protein [Rhodocyclus tenuis]|uniref:TolC family protein n=1 Tax=Rhodocyclus gracilis TaxID=2929842 RepID=A0ABX0WH24_9RHOO|nr:TolC family protein [Rhodocyclus gracilis]NJA87784.1 TolC family protein [Rhodocyclus gracilis]
MPSPNRSPQRPLAVACAPSGRLRSSRRPLAALSATSALSALAISLCVAMPAPASAAETQRQAGAAISGETYSLEQLLNLAKTVNRGVLAARDQVDAARSGIRTAGAFPNPEIEYLSGKSNARIPGTTAGDLRTITVTQPLPLPGQRGLREDAATAAADAASADLLAFEAETAARVKLAYFDVLRRDAEARAAQEDAALMAQIRKRIQLRVETGESARYELIKSDAELLNARKSEASAALRAQQARAALREAVGEGLPANFSVRGDLEADSGRGGELPTLAALREEVLSRNPELTRARAERQRAEHQLSLERSLRLPSVAVRASQEQDPELRSSRIGLVLTVPLWDQRSGPVGEASAQLARAGNALAAREFALTQALETAYRQFEIANTQVAALEGGIVRQAESALRVAEAAYRFGERGILDYLDAQRVFRAARNELITARYELVAARVDIERLRANR